MDCGGVGVEMRTANQIREEGLSVLAANLGPVDAIRFLQQFDSGHGDYTKSRNGILGNPTVSEIVRRIKSRRRK